MHAPPLLLLVPLRTHGHGELGSRLIQLDPAAKGTAGAAAAHVHVAADHVRLIRPPDAVRSKFVAVGSLEGPVACRWECCSAFTGGRATGIAGLGCS